MNFLYHHNFKEEGIPSKYIKVINELPSSSYILEVGCHTGFFSRLLIELGHKVVGIEKDMEAINIAKEEGVCTIIADIENLEDISLVKDQLDVILFMDVLEHLKDPLRVLESFKSTLKGNGCVIITGPNVAYWNIRKELLFGRWRYADGGIMDISHLHFYTSDTWKHLIQMAGYQIIRFEPIEGMLPLEHIFLKLSLIKIMILKLRGLMLKLMPDLFSISFFMKAVPIKS